MRPLEQATFQNAGERKLTAIEGETQDSEFKPGFRTQAEAVVKSARGETSAMTTLDDAVETMRLIAGIFQR